MKPATKKALIIGLAIAALTAATIVTISLLKKKPDSAKPNVSDVDGMVRKEIIDLLKILKPTINDGYIAERTDDQLKGDLKAMILNQPLA